MASLGLSAYRFVTRMLSPAVPLLLRRRQTRGKEHLSRGNERLGCASLPRPEGQIIWVHGASVGECVAALPLIDALLAAFDCHVLLTSGTVTSATVMQQRLPEKAIHQFVPVDTPAATAKFLDYWKPDAGLFVDSDIWPNLILNARARGVRLAQVNARISERSYQSWKRVPTSAAALLSAFDVCLAQDEDIAARFQKLGAPDVQVAGSLKADSPMLPVDPNKLAHLQNAIGSRPVFLAAQTHQGEEVTLLPAHDALKRLFPDLLTVIVPRHPERGGDIASLCGTRATKRRGQGELPDTSTAIYIGDTIGEMGLYYRLARFAFVGGSLIRHGGQNPLEPAKLGCAVLAGPHTFNFTTAYEAIFAAQGVGLVHSAPEIIAAARPLFEDPKAAEILGQKALAGAETLGGAVAKTIAAVKKMLDARA
ncbi:3-deoxy-D-manno-octulosonic-acid transferase [Rhizomicrobium palustre]|uniref:3-deoxy-D-manno-octulosonic acid transferase n=1 Tax=Rhizomicrobium palustre TaxID=189966 RepID=A0A846N1G9_9PROT|nr:3-deoxy-D-manno-octulosonic acid transferase [Rhizomicrobium palustre]NIK89315.1 3-deoxy-D-manno-octulosonic-acid transferase [Rhizomicrobium palustre]